MAGIAVTIVDSGGLPVTQVTSGGAAATAVASGGIAVTLCDNGTPMVIEGGTPTSLIDGAFDSGAGWALSEVGGGALPTISAGKFHSTAGNDGNSQRATQSLSAGSSPAGTYRITLDTTVLSGVDAVLLGAADQSRGSGTTLQGDGVSIEIVASGEVSKLLLSADTDGTIDNVTLLLVS